MTLAQTLETICSDRVNRLVVSNPRHLDAPYPRIEITLKSGREEYYQQANRTQTQVFHENFPPQELLFRLTRLLSDQYSQLNAWSDHQEYSLRLSKKGKVLFRQTLSKGAVLSQLAHNREKNYLIREGQAIPALIDMGVFTPDGRLVHSMSDKYRQINRFLEMVDDVVKTRPEKHLKIVDFGCGKSYLTFLLYYYFTEIRRLDVEMLGLDLKEDVIRRCNQTAVRYGYDRLRFEVGDIHGFAAESGVDMVITLHACDTATDFALQNAVACGASMIFSVPCCQHELNRQLQSDDLSILTRYGIIQERTVALLTDAIRANYLITKGYRTQLLEFVDLQHTPKNILIRAVKAQISPAAKEKAAEEIRSLCRAFHLQPSILKEN